MHGVAKVLELQLQHQSFQRVFRVDFLLRLDWFDLLAVQGTLMSLLQHHSSKASILQLLALCGNFLFVCFLVVFFLFYLMDFFFNGV